MDRQPAARERELTKSECFELLTGQRLGRLAFVDERGPIVLPVNFVLDRYTVIIRTDEGTKLDIAGHGDRVAFEVDQVDAATGSAWSVLIRGEAIEVTDELELDRLSTLPLRPWAPGPKNHFVRILPAAVTGRMIKMAGGPGYRSE
jgi:nitroimidazol reductase NimA-like FMN-containing flavoprotein (pyridoxamine 5'-phosphate oxidase superfamily)